MDVILDIDVEICYSSGFTGKFTLCVKVLLFQIALVLLQFILFFNWVEYKPASYGKYVYPIWADAVGWVVGLLPIFVIILTAMQQIVKAPKELTLKEVVIHA